MWGPGPRLTVDEMAARLGIDRATSLRTWRAAGFPDPAPDARVFSEQDIEMFALLHAGTELFGEDAIIQLVRVLGAAARASPTPRSARSS